jgi:hypothetical protein
VTDVGWCYYEEQVEICTPDYEEPEMTIVCSQTTDLQGCAATVPLVGTPVIPGVCNPDPNYTAVSADGSFCIQVPVGGCVELEVEDCDKICGPGGRVTGQDVLILRQLILGIINGVPANPFFQVLADVNCDGQISTLDLVLIQRFILGFPPVDNDCQPGNCIVFDPTSVVYDDNGDLISSSVKTTICDGDDIASFTVARMGDINGDCSCDLFELDGGGSSTELFVDDDVISLITSSVYDLALSLTFDRPVQQEDIELLLDGAEVHIDGSTLKLAYSSSSSVQQSDDHIQVARILGSDLQLTSVESESFTVTGSLDLSPIVYSKGLNERSSSSANSLAGLRIYVRGNSIAVDGLTDVEEATLILYNLSGQVVMRSSLDITGNEVELPLDIHKGIYLATVYSSDKVTTTTVWLP